MNITNLHLEYNPIPWPLLSAQSSPKPSATPVAKLMLLLLRIDELEDEIIREKLKINAVSGQLDDTFNEMLHKY